MSLVMGNWYFKKLSPTNEESRDFPITSDKPCPEE